MRDRFSKIRAQLLMKFWDARWTLRANGNIIVEPKIGKAFIVERVE